MANKKYTGVEVAPGVIIHAAQDIKPETIKALTVLAETIINAPDGELKLIQDYAGYLRTKRPTRRGPKPGFKRKKKKEA